MTVTKIQLIQNNYRLTSHRAVRSEGLYIIGEFEYGDADGGTTEGLELESLEELAAIQRYLDWKSSMSWNAEINYRCRTKTEQMENDFYAQAGEQWRDKYLWDGVQDWWPLDPTGGDCYARLETTYLVYSDGEHEWRVEK